MAFNFDYCAVRYIQWIPGPKVNREWEIPAKEFAGESFGILNLLSAYRIFSRKKLFADSTG